MAQLNYFDLPSSAPGQFRRSNFGVMQGMASHNSLAGLSRIKMGRVADASGRVYYGGLPVTVMSGNQAGIDANGLEAPSRAPSLASPVSGKVNALTVFDNGASGIQGILGNVPVFPNGDGIGFVRAGDNVIVAVAFNPASVGKLAGAAEGDPSISLAWDEANHRFDIAGVSAVKAAGPAESAKGGNKPLLGDSAAIPVPFKFKDLVTNGGMVVVETASSVNWGDVSDPGANALIEIIV